MRIKNILFVIILLSSTPCFSATLYMGSGETYTNLQAAMAAMSAGDTLIIRDGTYTGASNQIDSGHIPPVSDTIWTTIKAENDGMVIFDGQNARTMFYLSATSTTNSHWIFEGLIWANSNADNVNMGGRSYVKFLRCGAYEAGAGNNVNNFFIAGYSQYILLEGCYAWGRARTGITAWCSSAANRSSYIIFRNCVTRLDRVSAGNPSYNFGMYSVNYGLIQNCIAIDTDQTTYYENGASSWAGGIGIADTDYQVDNVTVINSIVLNSKIGSMSISGNNPANNIIFDNCLFLNNENHAADNVAGPYGVNDIIRNCTFHLASTGYAGINGYGGSGTHAINNSIISHQTSFSADLVTYNMTGNYCDFHGNSGTVNGTFTNGLTVDPIWSESNTLGGLKYPIKVENDSSLDGTGESGADIGANILYLVGTSETLYGETGYNTTTAVKMWPFPNEALIRSKMRAYTWDDGSGGDPEITGARGFAADDHTITEYILNYLSPADPITVTGTSPNKTTVVADVNEHLYEESGETDEIDPIVAISDSDPKTLTSGYSTSIGYTSSDANGIDECKWRSGSAPDESNGTACTGTTSGTCSVTGLVMGDNTIYVGCADPSNNWGSDSVTINAPSYRASAGGSYNIR